MERDLKAVATREALAATLGILIEAQGGSALIPLSLLRTKTETVDYELTYEGTPEGIVLRAVPVGTGHGPYLHERSPPVQRARDHADGWDVVS